MTAISEAALSVTVNGTKTTYLDQGSGEPLLLLHGSGPGVSALVNWRPVIPAFTKRYRVIAPDLLGFGGTDAPDGYEFSTQKWVAHVSAFLDALDLRSISIVGNSFGGALALRLAVDRPGLVKKLILMGSAGTKFPMTAGLDAAWGYTPSPEAMRDLLETFAFNQLLVNDDIVSARYQASIHPGAQESFSRMFPDPRQQALDNLAVPHHELNRLDVETLIVHGREDKVVPLSSSLTLLNEIPNAQLHVFPNCGHWAQIECQDDFTHLVMSFLEEDCEPDPK